jgi:esterase/lipase
MKIMNTQTITIGNAHGYVDLPKRSAQPKGVIIILPCFTCVGTLKGLLQVSEILTERGYATIRIDMTGIGLSPEEFSSQTILTHIEDAVQFAQYAEAHISSDIIFVGHGIGGLVGIFANDIHKVKGLITLSTGFHDNAYAFEQIALTDFSHPELAKIAINDNTVIVRKDFMSGVDERLIVEKLNTCSVPVLSVFFEEQLQDQIYDRTIAIFEQTRSNIETLVLNSVTHFMDSEIESYYVGNLIDIWSQNKLNALF